MSKWSQDQYTRCNVSEIKRKEKRYIQVLTTSLNINTPPISYTNPPPMSMTTLISKLIPLFVTSDKGVSTSSRHLIITRRAIIIILSIISTAIRCLGRGSHCVTTHHSLSSHDTTDTGIHLTQLIAESVKASIHVHKLCHNGLKCHSTH